MTMHDRIVEKYGRDMLRKSVLSIRGGAGVIESILGSGEFKTALEIGTYRGVGAAEISQYVERLHTIDLKRGKLEYNKDRGDLIDSAHDRMQFWQSIGVSNVTLHLVSDDLEKAEVIAGIDFDIAVIDGAHDQTVANDFELVKHCGAVLFHDYDSRGKPEKDYVYDFINTLPKHQVTPMDIFALWIDS